MPCIRGSSERTSVKAGVSTCPVTDTPGGPEGALKAKNAVEGLSGISVLLYTTMSNGSTSAVWSALLFSSPVLPVSVFSSV